MQFNTFWGESTLRNVEGFVKRFGVPKVTVEIGVFEGFTTFNMTNALVKMYPEYKHYAIDPYDASADLESETIKEAEKLFKSNLEEFEFKHNIEFMQEYSNTALLKLINQGVKADLIYVDGDHRAQTVLEDLVLGFQLLEVGGVMLCDDTTSWRTEKLQDTPLLALNSFMQCNYDRVALMHLVDNDQMAIQRIK